MPLRRWPLPIFIVSAGFLLGACTAFRSAIADPVASIQAPGVPICALGKPSPQTPNNSYNPYEVADVRWEYGLPCEPEGYQVDVSTSEDFSGEALGGTTDADSLTWIFDTPLDVAAHYYWRVAAIRDGYVGPFSETRVLNAGPKCVAGDDFGIHLLSPASSADVETLYPTFDWEVYGNGCIFYFGTAFWLYHGPDAPVGLSGPNTGLLLAPSGGSPYTLRDMSDGMRHWSVLEDCGTYYWRVTADEGGLVGGDVNDYALVTEPRMFRTNVSGACWCRADDLVAPTLTSPAANAHVGTQITEELVPEFLTWDYPAACGVLGYTIQLSPRDDFSDTALNGGTGSPEAAWSPSVPLRPATQYWWKVAASTSVLGPFSSPRSFFTGPTCQFAAQLTPPELFSPDDNAVLSENVATLHFQAGSPGCIPDGYFIDLQTSPTFAGENLLGEFNQPGTTVITDPLEDCTTYYWRVAAFKDWYRGPFSETRTFFTRTAPLCPERMHVTLVSRDALCRLGPAMQYPVVDTRTAGSQAEVVGRSADAGWLVITRSTGSGTCFMKRELLDFAGDVEPLPVIVAPPLPTLTPTAESPGLVCSAGLSQTQCAAAGGTWWQPCVSSMCWQCKCR